MRRPPALAGRNPFARMRARVGVAAAWCATLVCGSQASAAPADTLRPAPSANAHVVTETSQVLPRWTPSAGLITSYGQNLGVDTEGEIVIRRRTTTNVTFALGLWDRAEFLADLPMVLHQEGTATNASGDPSTSAGLQASALGDLRVGLKGTLLRTPSRGFGLGIIADLTLPTGDRTAMTSTGGVQFAPRLLAEYALPRGVAVAANVGYLMRPDLRVGELVVGDSVTLAAALRVPLDRRQVVAWVSEINSFIGVVPGDTHPVILRTGLRTRLRSGVIVGLYGGGAPITTVGVPQVHGMLAITWAPPKRLRKERPFDGARPAWATEVARRHDERTLATVAAHRKPRDPADPDGDGRVAMDDRCPTVAEDRDGFEDDDGCPELDNDHDGLRDPIDQCPNEPELINGALDWDGCPDLIVEGKVVALSHLDPARLVPKVSFADGASVLDENAAQSLSEFAELMRLNPWLGAITLRVYVRPSGNPVADRGLADTRARAILGLLRARGVAADRIRVQAPRAVGAQVGERARLAWANDPGARIPGPPGAPPAHGDTLERLLAHADQEAREAVAAPEGEDGSMAQGPASPAEPTPEPTPAEPPQPTRVSGAPIQPSAGVGKPPARPSSR